jgi:hypothetical protein
MALYEQRQGQKQDSSASLRNDKQRTDNGQEQGQPRQTQDSSASLRNDKHRTDNGQQTRARATKAEAGFLRFAAE